ncbi:MAG: polysaccharide biosynthesis protein, partial [Phaeodactylibacter sp.]|nr:polysaccharide biosynthesis protein [Phaeodactylibacter sp.]
MKLAQRLLPGKHQSIAGYVTKLLILVADFIFAFFSFFLALLITTKFRLVDAQNMVGWAVVLILLLRMAAFRAFRTYLIIIRYIGEKDYKNVFLAITASSVVFAAFLFLIPTLISRQDILPVVIVDYAILLVLAIGARMLMRMLMNQKAEQERGSHLNTAIFGAGELGSMLMRVLQYNGSHHYRPVAFFDDNPKVHGKVLNGIPVFNPKLDFERVVRKYDIRTAIIGINKLPEERRIHFINDCLDHNIKVMKVPPTENWLSNTLNIGQLKDIRFEDLLNRPPIQLDEEAIRESVNGKVVLVTGCAGSIGSEIVRQLLRYRPGLIVGIDQAETPLAELAMSLHKQVDDGLFLPNIGDVKDYDALYHLFQQYEPEYVFHAAAYKHVPMM